ncbi:MAG TPA: phasin family protein [Thermoanaerobaculia bacterium]|nr:phasin family protein [Thermoanaerobaculia bacterium]
MTTRKTTARKTSRKKAPKSVDDRVKQSAQKIWLAGLGAFALAEEEGGKLFRSLVSKGKSFEGVGREQLDRARKELGSMTEAARDKASEVAGEVRDRAGSTWDRVGDHLDDAVSSALHKVGVPTREEIQKLTRRIEHLTDLVEDKVSTGKSGTRKKARKPAAKKAGRKATGRKTARKSSRRSG